MLPIDDMKNSDDGISMTRKLENGVPLELHDWIAVRETLYLLSIKGMRESIKHGMAQAPETFAKEIDW